MKISSEKWYQKYIENKAGIEKGKIEIRKEFVYQQGYSSKVLVIYCITAESESMDIKLMEMKLWNGTHTKYISFKRTDRKVKLGTLHFNNMKNVEARYEVLENMNVLDNVMVGCETHNVKDYLLGLEVEDTRLFTAVEQGSGKMRDSMLVMVVPKAKVAARN